MQRTIRHIVIPAALPLLFFVVAATSVDVMGCRNRGLVALLIALISIVGSLVSAVLAVKKSARKDRSDALWWIISALILAVPPVALFFLA